MSNRQHPDAKLPDWEGPYFPDGLAALSSALIAAGYTTVNPAWIQDFGGRFVDFLGDGPCKTADDYWWFQSLHYGYEGGEVLIVLPHENDETQTDGSRRDRSMAVFIKGNIDPSRLIEELTDGAQQPD